MQDCSILVLGARSLIGGFLLPRLAARSQAVTALSRLPAPDGGAEGVAWLQADLTDPGMLAALPPVSAVIGLCPIWLLPAAAPALISAGARRIVGFSSTSRFTKAASADPHERAVAQRLAAGESGLTKACEAAAVDCTILRPTMIYAEGLDGNISRLAALARRLGALPLAGRGEGLRQPVHADDLALAALAALDRSPPLCAYDLPGGETLTYRAMTARVFEGIGRRPRLIAVPPKLWRLGFALAAPLLPGATAQMGERMERDLVFDAGPAARDLGWAPRAFHPDFSGVYPS